MKYDLVYRDNTVFMEPHYCREWDESGGCYGTNPNHGWAFMDAIHEMINFYERKIKILKGTSDEKTFIETLDGHV